MPTTDNNKTDSGLTPTDVQEMERYGVRRVPTDYYVYRAYRYANLADALAQARLESKMAD